MVFIFDTPFQSDTRQRLNACGDLALVLGAFPSLTRMFYTGTVALSPTAHPTV